MAQKVRIDLSDEERNELQRIARSETKPFREVQRARMILYSAQGLTDAEIAERLDCTPECVGKWRRRFGEQRFAGRGDKQRAGRPRRFPPEQVAEVKAIACEVPATHGLPLGRFTRTELHRLVIERGVTDASATTIWRWLHEDAIKPWQVRSWLFARDPDFQAKAGRVLDLYAPGSPRANRSSSWRRERTCGRFASDAGANRRTGQSRRPCPDQLSPPASFPR